MEYSTWRALRQQRIIPTLRRSNYFYGSPDTKNVVLRQAQEPLNFMIYRGAKNQNKAVHFFQELVQRRSIYFYGSP